VSIRHATHKPTFSGNIAPSLGTAAAFSCERIDPAYLVEIGGMVDMAFDDYLTSLKEGQEPRQAAAPADLNSSGDMSG
jgi:hypothetical protein